MINNGYLNSSNIQTLKNQRKMIEKIDLVTLITGIVLGGLLMFFYPLISIKFSDTYRKKERVISSRLIMAIIMAVFALALKKYSYTGFAIGGLLAAGIWWLYFRITKKESL